MQQNGLIRITAILKYKSVIYNWALFGECDELKSKGTGSLHLAAHTTPRCNNLVFSVHSLQNGNVDFSLDPF